MPNPTVKILQEDILSKLNAIIEQNEQIIEDNKSRQVQNDELMKSNTELITTIASLMKQNNELLKTNTDLKAAITTSVTKEMTSISA